MKTNTMTQEVTGYTYDVLGNLVRVDLPSGQVVEYLWDGQGRRVGKLRNGVLERQWLYRNQLKPVAELDGTGQLIAHYLYGSKPNVPDAVARDGKVYLIVSDQLGSPVLAINTADRTEVPFHAEYTAFGEVTGTGLDWMPFGFAGGMYDGDTGLVRFGARDYDATTGRWVSKDPIKLMGGTNVYEYVGNDPINKFDPLGFYGTSECHYYETRCLESGGGYYCDVAPYFCSEFFPKPDDPEPNRDDDFEGWFRCVRQCLQNCDEIMNDTGTRDVCEYDPSTDSFWDWSNFACHVGCYAGCAAHEVTGGAFF